MKRRNFLKKSAQAAALIACGGVGYKVLKDSRKEDLRTLELGKLFNRVFELPFPKAVEIEGLTKVDCTPNPWDISPLVIKTVDFIEDWHLDPKNINKKLIINIGENHSIATQNILYAVIAHNTIERLPNEKIALGVERSSNHINRLYDTPYSKAPMWDRYRNNGQWSPLVSYAGFSTYLCNSSDKLTQKFLFHAANEDKASVWFSDAVIDDRGLNRKKDFLLKKYMPKSDPLYPVSRDGYFFRNKVYATNVINQLESSKSRISINYFGKAHLLGYTHPEAFNFLQSRKGTLKHASIDDPVMHQYNIPYETSVHSWLTSNALQEKYDVLTVFSDSPDTTTGSIPTASQDSLTAQYNRTCLTAGIYATGLSDAKCGDLGSETDLLQRIKNNSPSINFPHDYNYDQSWYKDQLHKIERRWDQEKSSFVQPEIIMPDFGR